MLPDIRTVARAAVAVLATAFLAAPSAFAQGFGRNKVQYDTFDWQVLVTPHLEIHFYPEEEEVARRAAEYGEAACERLEAELGHELTKRIPLVVYGSHYHFRQNNVSTSLVGESTGGFTEIYRKRVVLPYAGSEEAFRHVIHHELVHAWVFDMLYGGTFRSLFVLQHAFYIPLWFMEGIAEYYSNRWDSEAEMMIRDAAVSGALPPFQQIHGGYFVYKAGWSAVGYLVERYGHEIVPDLLTALDEHRDLAIAFEEVTGEPLEKVGADWVVDVRKKTWPTYADLEAPAEYGKVLTHPSLDGSLNSHPGLSPSGTKLVFLSNRSGTPDLYLLDLESTRPARALVRGARGGQFESLHPLSSSVGWSPDERWVVAAAQKGARDALYVLDAETGRVANEIVPLLDAAERPDWSPVDARIVFTGMVGGQVDLYLIDADGAGLVQLTDDLWEERAPRWSPDGQRIVYATDRSDSTGLDLWTLAPRDGRAEPLRVAPGDQWDPCWSQDGTRVFHVSDEHGTRDLVSVAVTGGEVVRHTALLGGADSPSTSRVGNRLAFTAFHEGTWSVVLVDGADSLAAVTAPDVDYPPVPWVGEIADRDSTTDTGDVLAAAELTDYHPRFRTEWITGAIGYGGLGASGALQATISDVLGNHRVLLGAQVYRSFSDSDAYVAYSYLPRRIDYTVSLFRLKDYLYGFRTTLGQPVGEEGERAFFSERQWGARFTASYPFHTFRRIGFDLTLIDVERTLYTAESQEFGATLEEDGVERSRLLLPGFHHAFDNTLWGWTGPVQGRRSVFSVQHTVPIGGNRLQYGTASADSRWYLRFSDEYVLAFRGMVATSFGRDPRVYHLGGPNTLRGFELQEFRGTTAMLFSTEFRYPFLEYIKLGWPFRSAFGGIRGNLFLDVGGVFDDARTFHLTSTGGGLDDVKVGFGVGVRARLAYLPMRLDVGWATDFATTSPPTVHFSIGPEF